jgi:putative membrane protein insertion efficiency factor
MSSAEPADASARPSGDRRSAAPDPLARALLVVVRGYQRWLGPAMVPRCRFHPSCSAYAVTALERHGGLRGGLLALRRLLRCHPFHPGGVDQVPETEQGGRTR